MPAREGALRVLRAARDAGVKRVVLTSSFAAIGYGHPAQAGAVRRDELDRSRGRRRATPYVKSKTLAERAAWDFIAREGGALELSVVNPVGVFGPVLGPDYSTSILLVQRLMDGAMPGCPRLYFGVVDVRDVADLHIRAMTHPAAKGERFLAVAGDFMSIRDIAQTLKAPHGRAGADGCRRASCRTGWCGSPRCAIRRSSKSFPSSARRKTPPAKRPSRMLGWAPRSNEEALVATAESLMRLGLLKDGQKQAA